MSTQYRVPVLEQFEYQQAVISKGLNTPPGSPVKGDRYIVGASPTGAWSGWANRIAWYDGASWQNDTPAAGWQAWVTASSAQYVYSGSAWVADAGDMAKSVYDTNNDGIVDKAATVDDGAGNASSAANVKDAVTKRHTQNTDQYVDFGGANQTTAAQLKGAVTNSHVQGTDQTLDLGGANEVSAAQAKTAYDRRGSYDSGLKVILFNL